MQRRNQLRSVLVIAALSICATGATQAMENNENTMRCKQGTSPDLIINGCTAVIQSGRETTRNLANAFIDRGAAYEDKGDDDRAMQDFDAAIRLDPNLALAYSNRGTFYRNRGDNDRAVQDYDQAIRLNPDYSWPYFGRGIIEFQRGEFSQSATDFSRSAQLRPGIFDAVPWWYITEAKIRPITSDELAALTPKLDFWPAAVMRMLQGQIPPEQLFTIAIGSTDADTRRDLRCEATFFTAEYQLIHDNSIAAKALLRDAVMICPRLLYDYVGAEAELMR